MRTIRSLVLILASIPSINGCSSFLGLGEENFGCSGLPTGVKCLSALEVHKATDYKDYVSKEDVEFFNPPEAAREEMSNQSSSTEPRRRRFGDQAVQSQTVTYIPPHVRSAAPAPDRAIPIRTQPRIIRVWIAPWEDEAGYLNMSGYTYKELVPRTWAVGEPYTPSRFSQLKTVVQDQPNKGDRSGGKFGVGVKADPEKSSRQIP